jgi:hypothetical protein
MKDPLKADNKHENAGQKATLERTVLIREAAPGNVPPAEHLREQEEGTGVLGVAEKKSSGTGASGEPGVGGSWRIFVNACSSVTGCGGADGLTSSNESRSSPYFLRNSYRAVRPTRILQVFPMKSST